MKAGITMTLAACLGSCVAGTVLAAEPTEVSYFEVNYAFPEISGGGGGIKQGDIVARGGYNFNRNFGMEAMGAVGVYSEDFNGDTLKVTSAYGAYLKARFEAAPQFELYARAGWAHVTLRATVMGNSDSAGDSSFSYGVGAQYLFNKNWYVQGEYTSLYNKDGITINGPAIGVGYRF
jgi:opacity protein-like surface antigen